MSATVSLSEVQLNLMDGMGYVSHPHQKMPNTVKSHHLCGQFISSSCEMIVPQIVHVEYPVQHAAPSLVFFGVQIL